MKNPCPCPKKKKRKTTKPNKKVSVPAGSYNKFAGVRAPIFANTSGTFTMPGFAPIQAFPFPGLKVGNASQMYGLLTGSHLADLAAANIYRVQDRRDDVASGIGVTGLNGASKGNISGNSSVFSPNKSRSFSVDSVKKEPNAELTPGEIEKANRIGMESAVFNARNAGFGESKQQPISVGGREPSSRPKTTSVVLRPPTPVTQRPL